MNFISIIGLFVLLGIAWLISYHRSEIKFRPIIWGISLQFLFALIILRDDKWSFLGMIILGSLLITYMIRKDENPQKSIGYFFVILCISVLLIMLINNLYLLFSNLPLFLFVFVLCISILNYYLNIAPSLQKYFTSFILLNGISLLALNNLYGKNIVEIFSTIWTEVIIRPMINSLMLLYSLFFNNFGLSIIVFTVIIRAATTPLTLRQLKQTKALSSLTPKLKGIQEKYKENKQKLSQETMKLYKNAGVNPVGCLGPLIIQMPIWIGLFQSLRQLLAHTPEAMVSLSEQMYEWVPSNIIPISNHFLWLLT